MTSIPASRSALAMIFAPRSCPSRPGLAITTRILPVIRAAVYGGAPHDRRLLSGLAQSGRGQLGLSRGGRGAPAGGLRDGRPVQAPRAPRWLAAGRRDRHLALAPRPLGRPRPVGLGADVRARPRPGAARALGAAGRGREAPPVQRP